MGRTGTFARACAGAALLGAILLHVAFYASAWHPNHFLSFLFPIGQLHHNYVGLDFFAPPSAAWDFFHDKGTLAGGLARPDGWSGGQPHNANVYHPVFTLVVGGALSLLEAADAALAWQTAKAFGTVALLLWFARRERAEPWMPVSVALLLASVPRYHEIKIAQYQWLLDAALLVFLTELRAGRTGAAGVSFFVSLFVKPVGVLLGPVLALRGFLKPGLLAGLLFASCTLPFHFFPWSDYFLTHVFGRGGGLPGLGHDMYSLASLLVRTAGMEATGLLATKACYFVFVAACAAFGRRISTLALLYASALGFVLFDKFVYEYHYAILGPFIAVGLLADKAFRHPVALGLAVLSSGPSLYPFLAAWGYPPAVGGDLRMEGWALVAWSRVGPPLALGAWLVLGPLIGALYGRIIAARKAGSLRT